MKRIKTFALFESGDSNTFAPIINTINNAFQPIGIDMSLQSPGQGNSPGILSYCGPLLHGEIYNEDGIAIEKVTCELREIILSIIFGIDSSEGYKYELRFWDEDHNHIFNYILYPPSPDQPETPPVEIKSHDATLKGVTDFVMGIFDKIKTVECGDHYLYDPEYDVSTSLNNSSVFVDSSGLVASLAKNLVNGAGRSGGVIEAFTRYLNSLNDLELKDHLVNMDKQLIYGMFNMEDYLKKRGWSSEDFKDLELLKRMKKRSKYT